MPSEDAAVPPASVASAASSAARGNRWSREEPKAPQAAELLEAEHGCDGASTPVRSRPVEAEAERPVEAAEQSRDGWSRSAWAEEGRSWAGWHQQHQQYHETGWSRSCWHQQAPEASSSWQSCAWNGWGWHQCHNQLEHEDKQLKDPWAAGKDPWSGPQGTPSLALTAASEPADKFGDTAAQCPHSMGCQPSLAGSFKSHEFVDREACPSAVGKTGNCQMDPGTADTEAARVKRSMLSAEGSLVSEAEGTWRVDGAPKAPVAQASQAPTVDCTAPSESTTAGTCCPSVASSAMAPGTSLLQAQHHGPSEGWEGQLEEF